LTLINQLVAGFRRTALSAAPDRGCSGRKTGGPLIQINLHRSNKAMMHRKCLRWEMTPCALLLS